MSELLKKYESIDQSKLNEATIKILNRVKTITADFTADDEKNNKIAEQVLNEVMKKNPDSVKIVKRTPKAKITPKKTHKATHTTKEKQTTSSTAKSSNNIMSVAKEIQKAGESWKEAMERAKQALKERKEQVVQKQKTELEKLFALVKTKKELQGFANSDIQRDSVRDAKPRGARVVTKQGSTSNQYGTFDNKLGRKYWETRDRHADRLAPNYPKDMPLLASGGILPEQYVRVVRWADGNYRVEKKTKQNDFGHTFNDVFEEVFKAENFAKKISENNKINYIGVSTVPYDFVKGNKMAEGGMTNLTIQNVSFADGGTIEEKLLKELSKLQRDLNSSRLSTYVEGDDSQEEKDRIRERESKLARFDEVLKLLRENNAKLADGGSIGELTEQEYLKKHFSTSVFAENPSQYFEIKKLSSSDDAKVNAFVKELKADGFTVKKRAFSDFTSVMGVKKKTSFELGGAFMMTDLAGHTGGSDGVGNQMPLSGVSGTHYTGLVGETGAMSSGEMFEAGGAMMQNQQVINDASQSYVNYYLGEGASQGIYKNGGSIPNNYEGKYYGDIWDKEWTDEQKYHFLSDHKNEIGFDEEMHNESFLKRATKRKKSSQGNDAGFQLIDSEKLVNTKSSELPRYVKFAFQKHIREGQYAYGGKTKKTQSMKELYIEQIASLTGLRTTGVESFANDNTLTETELSNLMTGIGRGMISRSDFVTAVTGNKGNTTQKEVIAFAKSDKAYKMADGGAINGMLNKKIQKLADKKGLTMDKLGRDEYNRVMTQALVESLTDANYHDEAKEVVVKAESKTKWSDELYESEYFNPENNTADFAREVARECGWTGDDILNAYFFVTKMQGSKVATMIEDLFLKPKTTKNNSSNDWWQTVVNPNEDFNNYDDKKPIDWDVDDFKSWVVSHSDLDGNIDDEVFEVVKIPKSKLTVEYLNKNGSGKNNNEFYKEFGNWQSALYDIFTEMKKNYLKSKSSSKPNKYINHDDIKTVTVMLKGKQTKFKGEDVLNGANLMEDGGDLSKIAFYIPKRDVISVELKNGETIKPANGYWIKKGAEPLSTPNTNPMNKTDESKAHFQADAFGNVFVDSNFVNQSKGNLPNTELKHYGYGDFYLQTPDGNIDFIRTNEEKEGFVGRTHKMIGSDELILKLVDAMKEKGRFESTQTFADGGSFADYMNNPQYKEMFEKAQKLTLDVKGRVVRAIGIDSAIEFYDTDYPIRPYQLLERAVRGGYITLDEINERVVDSAMETAEDSEDMEEVGSSDFGAYLRNFLDEAGFKVGYVNGRLTREFVDGGNLMGVHDGTAFMQNPVYAEKGSYLQDNEGFMRADNNFNYRYPEKEVYIETLDEPIDLTDNIISTSNEVVIRPLNEDIDLKDDARIRAIMTQSKRGSVENFGKINSGAVEFINLPMTTSHTHKND